MKKLLLTLVAAIAALATLPGSANAALPEGCYEYNDGEHTWIWQYGRFDKKGGYTAELVGYYDNDAGRYVPSCSTASGDVVLPASVTNEHGEVLKVYAVGRFAFGENSDGVRSVTIPGSIHAISEYAFRNCYSLERVSVPASIKTIGEEAFIGCQSLATIEIEDGNVNYEVKDGILYDKAEKKAIAAECDITEAMIEDGTLEIGDNAFGAVFGLKSMTIPDSVMRVGEGNFRAWAEWNDEAEGTLYDVDTIPGVAMYDGWVDGFDWENEFIEDIFADGILELDGVRGVTDCAFYDAIDEFGITNLVVSSGNIGRYAFCDSTGLEELAIGDGVERIGDLAFDSCTSLTSVTIPAGVTHIGSQSFGDCESLEEVLFEGDIADIDMNLFDAFDGTPWLEETKGVFDGVLRIPAGMTEIKDGMFEGLEGLRSVYIPASVTCIGEYAFADCPDLEEIIFEERTPEQEEWTDEDDVTRVYSYFAETLGIGEYAFSGCGALTWLEIPAHVEYIGENAFENCTSLEEAVFLSDDSVTESGLYVEYGVFRGCEVLKSVLFDDRPWDPENDVRNTINIGESAFQDCAALTDLYFGAGVSEIAEYAFYGTGVEALEIPSSCECIGEYAFADCENLSDVYFAGYDVYGEEYEEYIEVSETAFDGTPYAWGKEFELCIDENGVLYDCKETGWCPWETLEIPEGVIEIADSVFLEVGGFTSVVLPASLTRIGAEAFAWSDVETVEGLRDDIETGPKAFAWTPYARTLPFSFDISNKVLWGFYGICPAAVAIPEGVTNIAESAFDYDCYEEAVEPLTSVSIPSSVERIEVYAFWGCENLSAVTIANPSILIDGSAFSWCEKLQSIEVAKTGYSLVGLDLFREKNPVTWVDDFDDDGHWIDGRYEEYEPDILPAGETIRIGDIEPLIYGLPTGNIVTNLVCDCCAPICEEVEMAETNQLYGVWATPAWAVNHGTVVFDANGGEGTMAAQTFAYGETKALDRCAFTRQLHEFEGWSVWADSDEVSFQDGGLLTNDSPADGSVVRLYAVWKRVSLWAPVADAGEGAASGGGDDAFDGTNAEVYDGFVYDAGGALVGTIQAKTAKAKNGVSKVTANIQLAGAKKQTVKGDMDVETGALAAADKSDVALRLKFGANGLSGTYGAYFIDGAQNKFSSKDKEDKGLAAETLKDRQGAYSVVWEDGDGLNILSLSVGTKGKVKVSGTTSSGVKVTATAQLLMGEGGACAIPVVVTKKANIAFNVWLTDDGIEVDGIDGAVAGKAGALKSGAAFKFDASALASALGDATYAAQLPDGLSVEQDGKKWIVAGGAKAGKVQLAKGAASPADIDVMKAGANPSALKLTYKAKDGTFKGTFKAYTLVNGKPKATTVNVSGILVGDKGYGTLSVKKPSISLPVTVE